MTDVVDDKHDISELIASDLIYRNSKEYAISIINNTFSGPIDGLKCVKRRILYTQDPKADKISGTELVSNALRIHPFGDASIYDTATRMAESFRNAIPLLVLIGTCGAYSGDTAAASRYTKFRLSDFCKDIFFNDINFKTIPTVATEDLAGREIKYFIPKVPTALLYQSESVGFGYNSRTIPLRFENVCDLVVDYVSCKDKDRWNYSKMAKAFVPCLPIRVEIKNQDKLINGYRNGNFTIPIKTEGIYVIQSNNSVLFRTLAYGISPNSIKSKLIECLRDKTHWLAKNEITFDTLSEDKNYIDFRLMTKRGGNVFELIDEIEGLMRIRTPTYVVNNFVYENVMLNLNPPEVIKLWHKERYRSILGTKKHRQQDLQLERMRLETYLIICEHVNEVVDIIKHNEVGVIYEIFKTKFGLSLRQCEMLLNANLHTLVRSKRVELENRLTKVIAEIETINESFKHIDKEIKEEVLKLKKKYHTNTTFTSSESDYIGCLIVGTSGIIQIRSLDEVLSTAQLFPGQNVRFVPYYSDALLVKFSKRSDTYDSTKELPYTSSTTTIAVKYKQHQKIYIRSKGRSKFIDSHLYNLSSDDKAVFNYTSNHPMMCDTAGRLSQLTDDELAQDSRRRVSTLLYAFDTIPDVVEYYIVISVNDSSPASLRLQRFKLNSRLRFSGAGETSVIGIVPTGTDQVILNLPEFHRYNLITLTDLDKYFSKGVKVIDLNIRQMDKS